MNARPSPDTREQVDSLLDVLPFGDRIPRRSEDLAFDQAWEIRAFSMTVALHRELGFPWAEFQQQLVEAIRSWEAAHDDLGQWSYYERWMAALEELASRKGWVSQAELDARSRDVLAQPANKDHQHAAREPVAVVASA
ncbi:nitrile hydratase accessory protein [Modestobacter sp. URMC 112]